MKSLSLSIDRTAYTAMVDALIACGSIKDALCIFGEIIKQSGKNRELVPKPHLYLSFMRFFASTGDFDLVKRLHLQMWSNSTGSICNSTRLEANELLMEAAVNSNQVDIAKRLLSNMVSKTGFFSWTSRGGMVAIKVETLSGFTNSQLRPYIIPQILLDDPVEKYMLPFEETKPLQSSLILQKVVTRFYKDSAIPVIDDWGNCIGIMHRRDCVKLDVPVSSVMSPPPCVAASTAVGRVIDLLLGKKYEMVLVVRNTNVYNRPLGVFSLDLLLNFACNYA